MKTLTEIIKYSIKRGEEAKVQQLMYESTQKDHSYIQKLTYVRNNYVRYILRK